MKAHLLSQIHSSAFPPGRPLPKSTSWPSRWTWPQEHYARALQELEADGLIRRVRGQGTFATTPDERHSLLRSNLLALILPQVREGLYPSLIHGFEQAVAGTGYQITVGNSRNAPLRQEALIRQAIDNNVAGVALVPTIFPATPSEQVQPLLDHRIPLVFCHRPVEGVAAPLVTWSGDAVGRMVAERCWNKGIVVWPRSWHFEIRW